MNNQEITSQSKEITRFLLLKVHIKIPRSMKHYMTIKEILA